MKNITLSQIHKDLLFMKRELEGIKGYMRDLDSIMAYDDFKAVEAYRKEKAEGRLTSHEDLKKELGI